VLKELLAQLWVNIHSIEQTSIRLYKSDALKDQEVVLIKNALFLWCGITLEKASAVLDGPSFKAFAGRFLKEPSRILLHPEGFHTFLMLLDEVDDAIIKIISSESSEFKARALFSELHSVLSCRSDTLWRTLAPLYTALFEKDIICVDDVRFLRQQSNLLSKIHIARPDLLARAKSAFYEGELNSLAETSFQKKRSSEYWDFILVIRDVLSEAIQAFDMSEPKPKHGPGAVSQPGVKTVVQKYQTIGYDTRIEYMLQKGNAEGMGDYSPFPLRPQDRASRMIFVPKTWKKLRGISAEPAGLQYFQQAVLSSIVKAIQSCSLRSVIDLSDQQTSRKMAKKGSRDGTLATIDLSSASDSVTTQIVKDVFGTSKLCRWLLATRSTHTVLDGSVRISKFAPMGSACCFPVQCLLFAGIILASASKHYGYRAVNLADFRVFGDDIICPSSMSAGIMSDLALMGFTVNPDKSYWEGDYRESCGMDAWRGFDVTPLKIQDFSFDFNGSKPLTYEHHSRVVSYLNSLYSGGYHQVRSFVLSKFLACSVTARKQRFRVSDTLVFGDGSRGTLYSPQPDNFHINKIPLKGLQRYGFNHVLWKDRSRSLSKEEESLSDEVNYLKWLIDHSRSATSTCESYNLPLLLKQEGIPCSVHKVGLQMVPTIGVRDPWERVTPHSVGWRDPCRKA